MSEPQSLGLTSYRKQGEPIILPYLLHVLGLPCVAIHIESRPLSHQGSENSDISWEQGPQSQQVSLKLIQTQRSVREHTP